MKKLIFSFTGFATFIFLTFSSCKKSNDYLAVTPVATTASNVEGGDTPTSENIWGIVIAAVATVIVALSEGQRTTTTTTNADGSSTTKTECSGVGSCGSSASVATNGTSLSGEDIEFDNPRDYQLNMSLELLEDKRIIYAVDPKKNENKNFSRFFYADKIKFLSPGDEYVIDNPEVLRQLHRSTPIVIKGDTYTVFNKDDGSGSKFIVIGSN